MNKTLTLITGFIAGAITGVATGILAAPDKGTKTTRRIKKSMRRTKKDLENSIGDQKKTSTNRLTS